MALCEEQKWGHQEVQSHRLKMVLRDLSFISPAAHTSQSNKCNTNK